MHVLQVLSLTQRPRAHDIVTHMDSVYRHVPRALPDSGFLPARPLHRLGACEYSSRIACNSLVLVYEQWLRGALRFRYEV